MAEYCKRDLFDLSGKVAIVTGGHKGIGKAIAMGLAAYEANIAIVDVFAEAQGQVAIEEIEKQTGVQGLYVRTNVSKPDQVKRMVERVIAKFRTIDILVNCAAIIHRSLPEETSPAILREIIDVNLVGLFNCCKEVGKILIENQSGKIINISSTDAEAGVPNVAIYTATKGGVNALTRALAVEWAPYGIRVNAISPCVVETDMVAPLLKNESLKKTIGARIPLGLSKTVDFQGPAVFLASDASAMVTGHILHVDGGFLAT